MRSIEELSETIVGILSDRKGFDDWWYSLEDEVQEEILEELQEYISEWLEG